MPTASIPPVRPGGRPHLQSQSKPRPVVAVVQAQPVSQPRATASRMETSKPEEVHGPIAQQGTVQPLRVSSSATPHSNTSDDQTASTSTDNSLLPPLTRASTAPTSLQPAPTIVPRSTAKATANPGSRPVTITATTTATPAGIANGSTSAAVFSTSKTRRTDPYHLAPEDAFYMHVPAGSTSTRDRNSAGHYHQQQNHPNGGSGSELRSADHRATRQSLRGVPGGGRNGSTTHLGSGRIPSGGVGSDSRSRSRRRRKRTWKKLLWVKQSYPDNYTDQATFLENLQRNPRLQPYDFWPLVADSTVIVQHVCSVIIFVVCFVVIFQERVSPVSVAGWGSIATCLGWLLWEWWADHEQDGVPGGPGAGDDTRHLEHLQHHQHHQHRFREPGNGGSTTEPSLPPGSSQVHPTPSTQPPLPSIQTTNTSAASTATATTTGRSAKRSSAHFSATPSTDALSCLAPSAASSTTSLLVMPHSRGHGNGNGSGNGSGSGHNGTNTGLSAGGSNVWSQNSHAASAVSLVSSASQISGAGNGASQAASQARTSDGHPPDTHATPRYSPSHRRSIPLMVEGRTHHRLATIKSAVLIYFTLLGLSPILKSLTRSTSSDSIWSMSFWLLAINIFFFDYSGVWVSAHKFPVASLSTNAALMASTVLASRLPSTGQVFSLTLFSIEVFGLFPVFRRYARHRSWRYHVALTVLLVLGAGAGVGIIVAGGGDGGWPWRSAVAGMVVGCLLAALAMGGCSWWLIGLQKYKNEIYGPWDPARPIIISRRHWDDV